MTQDAAFNSIYTHGLVRVAAAAPSVALADPATNARSVIETARLAHRQGVALVVFPQLTLTGVTAGDLLADGTVLAATLAGLEEVVAASSDLLPLLVVGAPLVFEQELYNASVLVQGGRIVGVTPVLGAADLQFVTLTEDGLVKAEAATPGAFPFGSFVATATDVQNFHVTADTQIANDSPNVVTVLASPCADPTLVGSRQEREAQLRSLGEESMLTVVSACPGFGESSTDFAWSGAKTIVEGAWVLAADHHYGPASADSVLTIADTDLAALGAKKLRFPAPNAELDSQPYLVPFTLGHPGVRAEVTTLRRDVSPHPFLTLSYPDLSPGEVAQTILDLQVAGLMRRLTALGEPKLVIGVSGGLDSTLALAVCALALDGLGRPRSDILAYTMPGFATTESSRSLAEELSEAVGATFTTLDIRATGTEMLRALDHPYAAGEPVFDVTFENVQAGLRTDYLFRLANHHGGLVIGTGDLSELALGWCTYGVGDQMSHYAVNSGLPKTAIIDVLAHLVEGTILGNPFSQATRSVLSADISPELVPGDSDADTQKTEEAVGPYELQDFTLYYVLNFGFTPEKIAFLQLHAWGDKYSLSQIVHWLSVFFGRFITQQFKRSALPDGPQVLPGATLSPRDGWVMPSDASKAAWDAALVSLREEAK